MCGGRNRFGSINVTHDKNQAFGSQPMQDKFVGCNASVRDEVRTQVHFRGITRIFKDHVRTAEGYEMLSTVHCAFFNPNVFQTYGGVLVKPL